MNLTLKNQIKKTFAMTISELKNQEETYNFLKEFLSAQEFENLAKRFSVIYWLSKKRSYENIKNNLNVDRSAIANGQTLLKKKEIRNALKNLDADVWAEKRSSQLRKLLKLK